MVTTARALQERVPIPSGLADLRATFAVGDALVFSDLPALLEERGFERVALVEAVGQFAVRGGILDIFSVAAGDPVRLEFWGDEIVSIRSFDIRDQRSTGELRETHVLPVDFRRTSDASNPTVSRSLVELLPSDAVIARIGSWHLQSEIEKTWHRVTTLYESLVESGATPPSPRRPFRPARGAPSSLKRTPETRRGAGEGKRTGPLRRRSPSQWTETCPNSKRYLQQGADLGHETLLLCDNDGQLQRLEEILGGEAPPSGWHPPRARRP